GSARIRKRRPRARTDVVRVGAHCRQTSRQHPPPARGNGKPFRIKTRMSNIAVIGGGAWGTGIAIVLGRKGTHNVRLWAHETDVCESIAQKRVNERFLPGRNIPDSVTATNDLSAALRGAQIVVSVMPSQHCRALFERMRPLIAPQALLVSATKGLEEGSLQRMSEVITDVLKRKDGTPPAVGALSGPSFAQEVARGDPTAITIASQNAELLRTVQQEFSDSSFRVYTNNDVVGVELGRDKKLPEIIAGMHGMVAEGVFTTSAAVGLAHARNVEMPITEQMHAILHDGKSPREAIQVLMSRTGKSETNQSY